MLFSAVFLVSSPVLPSFMSDAEGSTTHGDITTGAVVLRQPPHHRLQSLMKSPTQSRLHHYQNSRKKMRICTLQSQEVSIEINHLHINIKIMFLVQPISNKLYHSFIKYSRILTNSAYVIKLHDKTAKKYTPLYTNSTFLKVLLQKFLKQPSFYFEF